MNARTDSRDLAGFYLYLSKEVGAITTEYFFITDMHIGGDGQLQNCGSEIEPIEFLRRTPKESKISKSARPEHRRCLDAEDIVENHLLPREAEVKA